MMTILEIREIREREQKAAEVIDNLETPLARWIGRVGSSQADVKPLLKAVDRILDLHSQANAKPGGSRGSTQRTVCRHCGFDYPCPTIRVFTKALEVEL